ncbi:MAG: flippase-like domain-containing protein [Acidobacteria bacterium]|nr:flippase-like domain-containing protein [Acidobacteriota bacterium]
MNSAKDPEKPESSTSKHLNRVKIAAIVLTCLGIALFGYFLYSVGFREVLDGIGRIGFGGFAVVILLYFGRIIVRGIAWTLTVHDPYRLTLRDTIPAVIIGEAMSSVIPLGIVVSGTSKAIAVRKKVPIVVGLSSVATENLFYSLATGLFIALGAFIFLRTFDLAGGWTITLDSLIVVISLLLLFGILMVVRQWHIASAVCDRIYDRGHLRGILEHGRLQVRLFENLIYGFYRRYPRRFVPIFLLQIVFHLFGVIEVVFLLWKLGEVPSLLNSVLLESVSRLIAILFKLVPFTIGVDEASAELAVETLAIGAGIGVTLAIIRKGRVLFWAIVGAALIFKRGISFRELRKIGLPKSSE